MKTPIKIFFKWPFVEISFPFENESSTKTPIKNPKKIKPYRVILFSWAVWANKNIWNNSDNIIIYPIYFEQ